MENKNACGKCDCCSLCSLQEHISVIQVLFDLAFLMNVCRLFVGNTSLITGDILTAVNWN